jgi:hypothetical protein
MTHGADSDGGDKRTDGAAGENVSVASFDDSLGVRTVNLSGL